MCTIETSSRGERRNRYMSDVIFDESTTTSQPDTFRTPSYSRS